MRTEVRDVMGRVAIAVRLDTPFSEIVAAMKRFGVGAVTVLDADRRPVGVVSQDDLLLKETGGERTIAIYDRRRRQRERRKAAGVVAAELMTAPAITVTAGTPAREAARLMHANRIRQLPVIDPVTGRMVGTLHQADLLKVFTRAQEEMRADVEAAVRDAGFDPASMRVSLDEGVVTIGGDTARGTGAARLVEAIRRVEGVIDVVHENAPPASRPRSLPAGHRGRR